MLEEHSSAHHRSLTFTREHGGSTHGSMARSEKSQDFSPKDIQRRAQLEMLVYPECDEKMIIR